MATRQERCNVCGIQVWVPLQAQTFVCPRCRYITRRIVQPRPHPMRNYYPNSGMPGNGNYPRPSSMPHLVVPGRKRAVLCGVSYYGHPKSLKGSINDVRKMHDFLINTLGFPSSSVLLLTGITWFLPPPHKHLHKHLKRKLTPKFKQGINQILI
ncbi:unnamed protein product [Ilex paraguariensis]|uniref:Peptidase C14 caspase domain-containing protein n=1 Tax=Ilex paraguariensis TaxID=185542 RepID=A0ABC8T1N0_9AQUA